jgi:hypothetical protein
MTLIEPNPRALSSALPTEQRGKLVCGIDILEQNLVPLISVKSMILNVVVV